MEIQVYDKKKKKAVTKDISLETLSPYLKREKDYYIWIDTQFKEKEYKKLLQLLSIHPDILKYALTLNVRPQLQISKNILFCISYLPYAEKKRIKFEEVNFILTTNLLITIKKEPNKLLTTILNQIKKRDYLYDGPDNLMGNIINYFCTEYYPIVEELEENIEDMETYQMEEKRRIFIERIKEIKRRVLQMKNHTVHQLTILKQIIGRNIIFIDNKGALEDATHKMESIFNSINNIDNAITSIFDTYLNIVSTNMNEVMKVLTIIATIFLPLAFFTSWYGMNFYMPEIHLKHAYLFFIVFIVATSSTMLIIFKKNKWI